MKNPLLSICIPTYNRAEYLEKSIESIINQEVFSEGEIEIVISDNCSTDDTYILCKKYENKINNFHYFRNDKNICDENFPLVLSKAKGVFRKLCNDTLLFDNISLKYLLGLIKENLDDKPVIFFTGKKGKVLYTNNLDDFLYKTSFLVTWIGGVGVWGDYYQNITDRNKNCEKKLWQVSFLLDYVTEKKKVMIINKEFCITQNVRNKNLSYGLYKIFYLNFLSILDEYRKRNLLSEKCYNFVEKDLLFKFFPKWLYKWEENNSNICYDSNENLKALLEQSYSCKDYFKEFVFLYKFLKLKEGLKNILRRFLMRLKLYEFYE